MTRPHVVRADTLDLQPQDAPSAKDHSRQPAHPAPLGAGPPAPHQSLSLRNAEQEAYQEQHQSPRASEEQTTGQSGEELEYYEEPEQLNEHEATMHQNPSMQNGAYRRNDDQQTLVGGYSNAGDEETLIGDQEGDDEDMMDKISSSPSIDDGVFPLPPVRCTSVTTSEIIPLSPFSESSSSSSHNSSSPYTEAPRNYPLPPLNKPRHRDTSNDSGKKFSPLRMLGRKSSGSVSINSSSLNLNKSPSSSAPQMDLSVDPDPRGLRNPKVFGDHHHSQGGYRGGNPLKENRSKDSLNSSDLTLTNARPSCSAYSLDSTGSYSSGRYTEPIAGNQESHLEKAKKLLRGKRKELNSGTISDAEHHSGVGDAMEMAGVGSEDTVREVKKIEDYLLPNDDPLLSHHPEPNGTYQDNTEPGLTDDSDEDDSSMGDLDDLGPLVLDANQQAYMRHVRELMKVRGRDQNPGPPLVYDDDTPEKQWMKDDSLYVNPRFVGRGWAARCLRYAEDIDFESVYALHTFVATVEGQANCTKGDTMILLDDSNSYWWLVRVVKDGSIGYLPAEHIETPTERLARLNKHRNIDLAQTMLGDNPEKSKNPLKKAMKRRNAKTVQFAAPTYVEPSDVDYSSEEEGAEPGVFGDQVDPQNQGQENQQVAAAAVEPLKIKTQGVSAQKPDSTDDLTSSPEKTKSEDEMASEKQDGSSPRSRNGVLRNTDSFFKDDKAETRKITLTPNLLRDDSGKDVGEKELKTRSSLETFEKIISPTEQAIEDKKRKDKKPGMLSSLFKRKDRKSKAPDEDVEDPKKSEDSLRSSSSSQDARQDARSSSSSVQPSSPQRQPSKLQKLPPPDLSPVRTSGFQSLDAQSSGTASAKISPTLKENTASTTLRQDGMEPQQAVTQNMSDVSPGTDFDESPDRSKSGHNSFSRAPQSAPPAEPNQRYALDDFDPLDEVEQRPDTSVNVTRAKPPTNVERLSESPIQVSPMDAHAPHDPPGLIGDSSSQEEPSGSPVSAASSTQMVDAPESKNEERDFTPGSTASSVPTTNWSSANLLAYLDKEQDQDIRDMMRIIEDTTGVQPAGPEHPIVGNLYAAERKRLAELTVELDHMHRGYLDRKGIRY